MNCFKLKVGFGLKEDLHTLNRLRTLVGPTARIMIDANQAWDLETAKQTMGALADFDVEWIEEPIPADSELGDWQELARSTGCALAAGENLRGKSFEHMIHGNALQVLQPDVIKWGGISGCRQVARQALNEGLRFCPHYLGGGVGLLATAHLMASMGVPDLLEFDVSENPWIEGLAGDAISIEEGRLLIPQRPGHGASPDLKALRPMLQT